MSEVAQTKDDIVIDEVITIDGTELKNERSEFATVVFHNIAETYPEDAHVECNYTVTSDLVPTSRDWVALYKVGWMSPKDYIYYEWAPLPKDYTVGQDADASVLFPAHKLPNDDGEFYQFCYVSSSKQIRGASTPFQFRRPGADDYIEIEDEEANMLVIRSKTIFLEENLQKAELQKQRLQEAQEALQKERDNIITKYQEAKNRLVAIETHNASLVAEVARQREEVGQLKTEMKDMLSLKEELELKINNVEMANAAVLRERSELKVDLAKAKSEMQALQREKDELAGNNAVLQEQADLYKNHYTTSSTNLEQYSKQSEELQIRLAQQESLIDHLKHTTEKLNAELEDNRQNLDKQTGINIMDKDRISELQEQLKNVEDKLSAAEQRKQILQEEMLTYKETQDQLSRQIEKSKLECDSVKQKLCSLEEDFTQKTLIQKAEIEQLSGDLADTIKHKEQLQGENVMLHQRLSAHEENCEVKVGSMSIMQQSLSQIKSRLEKKEKTCRGLERSIRGREQEFIEREREMRREIEDLKEKIYMCSDEYKTLYIEKSKLQRKLEKLAAKRKSKSERATSTPDVMVESEMSLKSAPGEGSEVSSAVALERQVEELEEELNKKLNKKQEYKQLYKEERSRGERLQGEVNQREGEIEGLKKRAAELPAEIELKIWTLEKCVNDKEVLIKQLNEKVRMLTQARNDESGASMSPRTPAGPPSGGTSYIPCAGPQQYPYPYPMQYPQAQGPYCAAPMVYPEAPTYPQLAPVVYPSQGLPGPATQAPPIPPRDRKPTMSASSSEASSDQPYDQIEDETDDASVLAQILTPLPAPLEPEKLPSAKIAAVKSAASFDEAHMSETVPKHDINYEDKFFDAEGSSMKLCPDCGQSFPADVSEEVFLEHTLSHITTLCPQCKKSMPDNMTDDAFTRHVNSHFDKQEEGNGADYEFVE
ncbi:tax1-binding protein 1 homolog isoform X2 [Mya arenaria]|uniref:tax1-binding protein 1 homolog isoform X2 n=1 Tax=Mya arenaria TaxID=6604 RepID=UPI0022E5D1E7|nr:tax1-binding protein 1 homolog isoform X2 [Mya arenaria]